MKRGTWKWAAAVLLGLTVAAGASYTRDPSGSDTRALLVAIEYLIHDEDAAHTSTDCGIAPLTVRKDTAATTAGTDGDYANTISDANGCLWVHANGSALESGGNLASLVTATSTLKAATDLMAASGGGAYVRQDSTGTIAKETGGNLATVKTNTDTLVTAGGGGYVRQDSTGTIAKETGGNLATVKTNTDTFVTAGGGGYVRQDSTGTIAKETGGNLATVKTNTDTFVTAGGGGYIRQDSTGTVAKETGGNLATLAAQGGSGVTYVRVAVNQGAPASTVIVAAEAGQTVCIHEAVLSVDVADTLIIEDSDGTDFAPFLLAATGQARIPLDKSRSSARFLVAGKGLTITTAAGKATGYIVYSKAAS